MPKILKLKVDRDGHVWARLEFPVGDEAVSLWTEAEKTEALRAERDRCVYVIEKLGREGLLHRLDELLSSAGISDDEPTD